MQTHAINTLVYVGADRVHHISFLIFLPVAVLSRFWNQSRVPFHPGSPDSKGTGKGESAGASSLPEMGKWERLKSRDADMVRLDIVPYVCMCVCMSAR